ncbi:hypothetical protein [Pseudorhodoplanes sinuspersici]|uniref:Lipoprotein n=1 Tax=Pseudorhodoplanes sinuspersici TaxID=1235591 RepID=A0A1W6ZX44_9HYPH|nr:hypothetical protein [Pseudorhodoplanes sinuspersici]ARQ01952.1 hypothetical protein CAK95_24755 [Pseudorhodoplanes sinuspersici]
MLQRPSSRLSRLGRPKTLAALAALVLLQGCSTAQIDSIPHAVGGLPEGAPPRPAEAPAYPAVHDMPPDRGALLDAEQQKRLHDDLIATRNRQPNQEKNIARDKKRAQEEAKKMEEAKNKPKDKKKGRRSPSQPTGLFSRGNLPPAPETAGASRNP